MRAYTSSKVKCLFGASERSSKSHLICSFWSLLISVNIILNLSALLRYKRCWYTKEGSLSIRWLFRDWRRRRNMSPSSSLLSNTGKTFGSVMASRCMQAPCSFLVLMVFTTWQFSLNDLLNFELNSTSLGYEAVS